MTKAAIPIEAVKSTIEAAYCHAPASKPGANTIKMAAKTTKVAAAKSPAHMMPTTKTAAAHARENWAACNQNTAERGRRQQYTEASHRIFLPVPLWACGWAQTHDVALIPAAS